MEIIKFKKVMNDKYKLYLSNGDVISLYEDVIVKNNLLLTKKIDKDMLDKLLKQNNEVFAYELAIKYISIRIRSIKELKEYLLKKDISNNLIDLTINRLIKEGYLDDYKFAKAYINDQILLSNAGPYKIKCNLIKLGIKESVISELIEEIDSNKIKEKLSKQIEKQLKLKKGSCNSIKIKLTNYLVNLGYDKKMIMDELCNYEIKSNKDELKKDYDKLYNKYKNKYEGNKLTYFIAQKLYLKGYTSDDVKEYLKEEYDV